MKLEIEYPIVLEAIPKRSTQRKLVVVRDVHVVDIPEYSQADMPISFREQLKGDAKGRAVVFRAMGSTLYTAMTPPVVEDGRVRYVFGHRDLGHKSPLFHDEAHARAVNAVNDRCRKLKSAARTGVYPEGLVRSYAWTSAFRMNGPKPDPVELPLVSDGTVTGFDDAELDLARERMARLCDRLVLMDGRFMMARTEPVYMVDNEDRENEPVVKFVRDIDPRKFSDDDDAQEPTFNRMLFRLDELELAIEYASELWRLRTGESVSPTIEGNAVELIDASYLSFDGDAAAVANTARIMHDRYVQSMSLSGVGAGWHSRRNIGRRLSDLEPDSFAAFQSLSRALGEYEDGADGEELHGAVRRALDSSGGRRFLHDSEAQFADLFIGRWERRHARREFGFVF